MRTSEGAQRPRQGRLGILALLAVALVFAGVAVRPPAAAAGGPGTWTDISGPVGSLLVQPDTARGGALHVVWSVSGTLDDLNYRQIAANGTPAGAIKDLTPGGWPILSSRPAIVAAPAGSTTGVDVFAGAQSPAAVLEGLADWYSGDNGASFGPAPVVVTADGAAYGGDVSAVVTPGAVFQTWANTFGVFTHRGETPSPPAQNVNDVGNYGYNPAFGYDAVSGRLYVVAEYNATGKEGLWARQIDPATGLPAGGSFELSNSSTMYGGTRSFDMEDTRTPVAGLIGQAVVLVAYPTGYPSATTLRVWRITPGGQTTSVLAGGASAKGATAVSADPSGRAWVVWTDSSSTPRRVYASRSNVGATAWGKTVSVPGPGGTDSLWQLAASAQSDRVDVLAQYGSGSTNRIYHTQVLAGLTVTVKPAKAKAGKTVTVKVTVKDAGVAVSGAKVKIGKKSATTAASGVAKVKVKATKAGKLVVTVTKAGYANASATIKVAR